MKQPLSTLNKDLYGRGLNLREERWLTWLGLGITVAASVMLIAEVASIAADAWRAGETGVIAEQGVFLAIVLLLIYGNLIYQITRLGYHSRLLHHREASREELNQVFDGDAPSVVVLVPSYKEETRVVRQSLLSAALQEYPRKRL